MAVCAQDGNKVAVKTAILFITLLLCACAGGPMAPEWQSQSHASLERFRQHYLEGNTPLAQRDFAEAKTAVAATGRPELTARVELVRCALGTAALDLDACSGFDAVRDDALADDRLYGDFVVGRLAEQDAASLPSQYRGIATGDETSRNKALQRIEDPVSRLVAAGVLFRLGQLSPDGLDAAIDTASAQGYRRPLLAYLNVQSKRAESAGDAAALQAIRKRIELVYQSLPK
jgi:hypothetical protein